MDKVIDASKKLKAARDDCEKAFQLETDKLDAEHKRLADRLNDLNKKKEDTARVNGDLEADDNDIVEINAGGKIIAAKRGTLAQMKGTRIEALFSGRWDKKLKPDGTEQIFLDVNPVCFQAIVDYLNELTISSKESPPSLPKVDDEYQNVLLHQLRLFGVVSNEAVSNEVNIPESNIINDANSTLCIHDWLEEDGSDGDLKLLYRGSRDGFNAPGFQTKCKNIRSTLTVIQTTENGRKGPIFGGYSNTPWRCTNGSYQYIGANKAFLFALPGGTISSSSKLKLKDNNDSKAIFTHNYNSSRTNYGPVFGSGNDLSVQGTTVYLSTGNSYECDRDRKMMGNQNWSISEIEVFQVVHKSKPKLYKKVKIGKSKINVPEVSTFSSEVNNAIKEKWISLKEFEEELLQLEESFEDEGNFISSFACGKAHDTIALNVSGTSMATCRSTLQLCEKSALAAQFALPESVKENDDENTIDNWNPEDVLAWLNGFGGISESTLKAFEEDGVSGRELLALGKEGLLDYGVKKGKAYLLLEEIRKLKTATKDNSTFIEHSPYCFEKIIDFLRMKRSFSQGLVASDPKPPVVRDSESERFKKVVKHYFPGDTSKFILEEGKN